MIFEIKQLSENNISSFTEVLNQVNVSKVDDLSVSIRSDRKHLTEKNI